MNPKVSIIILNWNGLKDTIECLESVSKIDYPNFETIVVDNGSADRSPEQLKSLFPEIVLIQNKENLGYTGGNNVGIRHALKNGADYVWLLNNDTVIEKDTLKKLMIEAERSSEVGLLSPVIYHYSTPEKIQHCGSYFYHNRGNLSRRKIRDLSELSLLDGKESFLFGTALLIKRIVIEKIGYLDERFFAYSEDIEYSIRALSAGFLNKILSTAKVFHKTPEDRGDKKVSPQKNFYMIRNDYLLWRDKLRGIEKLNFLRTYLIKVFKTIASAKETGRPDIVDASLEGMYCAFKNIVGKRRDNIKIPAMLKAVFLWHPYFFADLLDFNIKNIFKTIFKKDRFVKNEC